MERLLRFRTIFSRSFILPPSQRCLCLWLAQPGGNDAACDRRGHAGIHVVSARRPRVRHDQGRRLSGDVSRRELGPQARVPWPRQRHVRAARIRIVHPGGQARGQGGVPLVRVRPERARPSGEGAARAVLGRAHRGWRQDGAVQGLRLHLHLHRHLHPDLSHLHPRPTSTSTHDPPPPPQVDWQSWLDEDEESEVRRCAD